MVVPGTGPNPMSLPSYEIDNSSRLQFRGARDINFVAVRDLGGYLLLFYCS